MSHLKRDRRGYPIPHGVVIDKAGNPHFAINDDMIRIRVIREGLCSICGTKLFRGKWLIGGALSAFHEHGAFIDPPMHSECAHFALKACPYLAAPRYSQEIGLKKAKASAAELNHAILYSHTLIDGRPQGDMFVALMVTGKIEVHESTLNLKPKPPYSVVEYWRHGQQLSKNVGEQLVQLALKEFKG